MRCAPTLIMAMTGHYWMVSAELFFERARSTDKELVFVEGASHNIVPCRACESTPGEYGEHGIDAEEIGVMRARVRRRAKVHAGGDNCQRQVAIDVRIQSGERELQWTNLCVAALNHERLPGARNLLWRLHRGAHCVEEDIAENDVHVRHPAPVDEG